MKHDAFRRLAVNVMKYGVIATWLLWSVACILLAMGAWADAALPYAVAVGAMYVVGSSLCFFSFCLAISIEKHLFSQ